MLIQILIHTPAWVYAIFALLAFMGGRQLRPGSSHLYRVVGMPLAMIALAIYGLAAAFGQSPAGIWALGAWAVVAGLVMTTTARLPLNPAVRYDRPSRRLFQPGSWMPLALMMGIFLTKYGVGVTLALHPEYAHRSMFAVGISTLYGVFSGVLAGRALRLWRLMRQAPATAPGAAAF